MKAGGYGPEIVGFCEPTAARRIGFEESLEFERTHEESYRMFGYELVDIPAGRLTDRVATIRDSILRLTSWEQSAREW